MKREIYLLSVILFFNAACYFNNNNSNINPINDLRLADKNATLETKALYYNLHKIASKFVLFGQQDATACGISWKNEDLRSDINDVCGSFPSIYGWNIEKIGSTYNIDSISFDRIKFWIKSAYGRGGVNVICWNPDNTLFESKNSDTADFIIHLLPGGKNHQLYIHQLDCVADFLLDLKSKNGTFIPVIFKPFKDQDAKLISQENNHCSPEHFKKLWHFSVEYLRDKRHVHNVLYAYSTTHVVSDTNYILRYPGNKYVDILGLDDYYDFQQRSFVSKAISQLRIIVKIAKQEGKVSALTETGQMCIYDPEWWTESLLYPIKNDNIANNISFIMVWRNANINSFYAPFPGHPSVRNFIKFENDPYTLFEDDLPSMYQLPE